MTQLPPFARCDWCTWFGRAGVAVYVVASVLALALVTGAVGRAEAQAPPSTARPRTATSTPIGVRRVVDAAVLVNGEATPRVISMRAETEVAVVQWRASGLEEIVSVQQQASRLEWTRDSLLRQHIVGYRAEQAGLSSAMARAYRAGWIIPVLQGERLRLRLAAPSGESATERALDPVVRQLRRAMAEPETLLTVHPLAADAGAFYEYPAIDTIAATPGGDSLRGGLPPVGPPASVFRLHVTPRQAAPRGTSLFEGFVDVDPATLLVARLRGRIVVAGAPASRNVSSVADRGDLVGFVDLRSTVVGDGIRLPVEERIDILGGGGEGESGTRLRFVTRFEGHLIVDGTRADGRGPAPTTPAYDLSYAPADSLRAYDAWSLPMGHAARAGTAERFGDLLPDRMRTDGPSRWSFRARNPMDAFRFNKVEGFFTGLSATWHARDALPGVRAGARAGWAWSEEVVRGAVDVSRRAGAWTVGVGGGRTLDLTNDFRSPFDSGSALSPLLFSADNYDYVDRRGARLAIERDIRRGGVHVSAELARLRDAVTIQNRTSGFVLGPLMPNRTVDPGSYTRAVTAIAWNPSAQNDVTRERLGAMLRLEAADGELDYQRIEGALIARMELGTWELIGRAFAGAVLGDVPTQQLFELGAQQNLPGYDYKAFAGDRAWVVRGTAHRDLPVLRAPRPLVAGFVIPALAPQLSLGLQGGMAWASDAEARAAVRRLGDRVDWGTGEVVLDPESGVPLAASVPSRALRSTVSVGVRLLSGAVYTGLAMPIDATRDTRRGLRVIVGFGRQL